MSAGPRCGRGPRKAPRRRGRRRGSSGCRGQVTAASCRLHKFKATHRRCGSAVATVRKFDRWQFCCRRELRSATQPCRLSRCAEAKSCVVAQPGMSRSPTTAWLVLLQLQLLQSPHSFSVANVEVAEFRGQLLPLWGPIGSWAEVRGCETGLSAPLIGAGSPLERPGRNTHGCCSGVYLRRPGRGWMVIQHDRQGWAGRRENRFNSVFIQILKKMKLKSPGALVLPV